MRKISLLLCLLIVLTSFSSVTVLAAHDPYMGIEMTAYDDAVDADSSFSADSRGFIRNLRGGAYVVFKDVNFGDNGPSSVDFYAAAGGSEIGITSLYIDDPNSQPVAEFQNVAGDWITPVAMSAEIKQEIKGVHDIYLKNRTGVCNMFRLMFYEIQKGGVVYNPGDYFEDIADNPYRSEINMFHEMGILNGFSETDYEPNLYMTRGDFATVMYRLLGTDGLGSGTASFSDVLPENENSNAVSWLYSAGIISGDGNGEYRPYDYITVHEAATIAVNILGYGPLAKENGGFPIGYMNIAARKDLFKGISADKLLTRGQIAKFLYNLINTTYLDVESVTSDGIKYVEKFGILEKEKGIYTNSGLVTANELTALKVADADLDEDTIMIDNEVFYVGETAAASMLGYEVIYYYREVDKKKILTNIRPDNSSTTVITSAKEDILTFTESVLEYYNEDGKLIKHKFDSDTAFIYNGKAVDKPLYMLLEDDKFSGRITYIENSETDVVLIEQHKTITVDSIDTMTYEVFADGLSDPYLFDPDIADVSILLNNEPISFTKLTAGMLLSVFESKNETGKKRLLAYIEENVVNGMVSAKMDDTVTIDNAEYKVNMADGNTVEPGNSGTFHLNYLGEIVAYTTDSPAEDKLEIGMFVQYKSSFDGFDTNVQLKIYNSEGKTEIYDCANTVQADGVKITDKTALLTGSGGFKGLDEVPEKTLLQYKFNSKGEISLIDTCLSGDGGKYDKLTNLSSSPTTYYFNIYTHSFLNADGKTLFVYDETPEAFIFSEGTDVEKLHYNANLMSFIGRETSANGEAYSVDSDALDVDFFVWHNRIANTETAYTSPFAFDEKASVIDTEGNLAYEIRGYTSSGQIKYTITEDFYNDPENANFKKVVEALRLGDVIRFKLDLDKVPTDIELIYLRDGGTSLADATPAMNSTSQLKKYDRYQYRRCFAGEVTSKIGDIVTISCNVDGETVNEILYCKDVSIASYSASLDRIYTGLPYSNFTIGSKVLVCIDSSKPSLVLRYDN